MGFNVPGEHDKGGKKTSNEKDREQTGTEQDTQVDYTAGMDGKGASRREEGKHGTAVVHFQHFGLVLDSDIVNFVHFRTCFSEA